MALTQDQIAFFARNGYLRYRAILGPEELGLLRCEYDREFEKAYRGHELPESGRYRGGGWRSGCEVIVTKADALQIMQVCDMSTSFEHPVLSMRL